MKIFKGQTLFLIGAEFYFLFFGLLASELKSNLNSVIVIIVVVVVVGTPGRILALARDKDLGSKNVRHFILDECDKMLESLGMVFLFFYLLSPCLCELVLKCDTLQFSCSLYSVLHCLR